MKWLLLIFVCCFFQAFTQKPSDFQLAKKYNERCQIDSAYLFMRKALQKIDKLNEVEQANYYTLYGRIIKLREKTDSSFLYYQKALELYERNKKPDSVLYSKILMAELFRYRGVKDMALKYIKEAEKMVTPKTPADIRAYYYNRRAAIEAMLGNNALAEKLSLKVIEMQDSITNKETVVYSYNEYGYIYEHSNPEKSKELYLKAIELVDKHNLLIAKVDVLTLLSRLGDDIYVKLNYLEQAYELAIQLGNDDMIFAVSRRLFDPYYRLGDYEKAAKYCRIALYYQNNQSFF